MEVLRRKLAPELEIVIPLNRDNLKRIEDGSITTPTFLVSTKIQPDEYKTIKRAKRPHVGHDMVMAKLHELANVMGPIDPETTNVLIDTCTEHLTFLHKRIFGNEPDTAKAQMQWNAESIDAIRYYMQERLYQVLAEQAKTNQTLKDELETMTHQDSTIFNLNVLHYTTKDKDVIDLWLKYNAKGKATKPLRSFLKI